MNHGKESVTFSERPKRCCVVLGGNTDLLSKEGHDGEDDQRHEDTVRPKLQLVPVHSPEAEKTHIS